MSFYYSERSYPKGKMVLISISWNRCSCGRPGEVQGHANTTINAGHYSHAPGPIGRPQETPLLTVAGPIGRPQETPLLTVAGPIGRPRETLLLTVARRTDDG